jgi:hypothetical protein
MVRVTEARYVGDCKIHVHFSNGKSGIVDLGPAPWGPAFETLRDPTAFQTFLVSPVTHTIEWDNGADLAPEYLEANLVPDPKAEGAHCAWLGLPGSSFGRAMRRAWPREDAVKPLGLTVTEVARNLGFSPYRRSRNWPVAAPG